jgi:carbonic anhydrase
MRIMQNSGFWGLIGLVGILSANNVTFDIHADADLSKTHDSTSSKDHGQKADEHSPDKSHQTADAKSHTKTDAHGPTSHNTAKSGHQKSKKPHTSAGHSTGKKSGASHAEKGHGTKTDGHSKSNHGNAHVGGIHWGYHGAEGPEFWGDLKADWLTCKTGRQQSPIQLDSKLSQGDVPPLQFMYTTQAIKMFNNGHTIQMTAEPGSTIQAQGKNYSLLQFHMHTPSEEAVDGQNLDLVIHMVHKSEEGQLAVVGVLFKKGTQEHPGIAKLWKALPAQSGDTIVIKDSLPLSQLLPTQRNFWHFQGSLTTPPCSEGVQWYVLRDIQEISASQLKAFQAIFPNNARPIQPLNGREIRSGS